MNTLPRIFCRQNVSFWVGELASRPENQGCADKSTPNIGGSMIEGQTGAA